MRLIDADALKEKLQECINSITIVVSDPFITGVKNGYESAKYWIDEAPTVEERKYGHWKNGCCTVCGESAATDSHFDFIPEEEQNYCWNCGAIMEEKKGDVLND